MPSTKSTKSNRMDVNAEDQELKKIIGGRIKRVRLRLNRTARWVAEIAGISRISLTQIENGNNNVSAVVLWKIAGALRCDIREFFPDVPNAVTLAEADLEILKEENRKAAEFMKRAHNVQ